MSEAKTRVQITELSTVSVRLLLSLIAIGVAIFSGAFWAVLDMRASFTRMEVAVETMARSLEKLERTMSTDAAALNAHLSDPTIHHARLNELEAVLLGQQRQIDDLLQHVEDLRRHH